MSSEIHVNCAGQPTAFIGPDATQFFRVRMIRSAIRLHRNSGILPTRGVTITKLFAAASTITGKPYKRGQHNAAIADLDLWLSVAESSLPIVTP